MTERKLRFALFYHLLSALCNFRHEWKPPIRPRMEFLYEQSAAMLVRRPPLISYIRPSFPKTKRNFDRPVTTARRTWSFKSDFSEDT